MYRCDTGDSRVVIMPIATALIALTALSACLDNEVPIPKQHARIEAPVRASTMASCGVSYVLVTDEFDSLMSRYGLPSTQDTTAVCETWTGTDYVTNATVVGSSDNNVSVPDTIQGVAYSAGVVTGLVANGGSGTEPTSVGGATLFDFVQADSAQRQASNDAPYYGVYAGGGGTAGCTDATCLQATRMAPSSNNASLSRSIAPAAGDSAKFRRHGLHRGGVRALVDSMEEIAPSAEGYRRFHRALNGEDVTLSVDPVTELLVGEDVESSDGTSLHARHGWRRIPSGFVRDRTDIVDEEIVRGHRLRNRSTIWIKDVHFGGVDVMQLKAPTP